MYQNLVKKNFQMSSFVFFLIFGILCSISVLFLKAERNTVINYLFKSIDPDSYLTTLEIIQRHGYPAESHIIQSEDGYLLGYHRIPHGKFGTENSKSYPVILHHGVLSCSADWIINGPEKSLAYRLADEGYDVWLANARGSTESKAHVTLSPSQRQFWNFTFHEMGKYDLPAVINYILNVTNKEKVIYIGHSQGTTIFYVFAITRPELSDKVLIHISLGPTAMIPHATTLFRNFLPEVKKAQLTGEWYKKGPIMEYNSMIASVSKFLCSQVVFKYNLCEQLFIFRITGRDDEQFHKDLYTVMLSKMPAGTSSKNLIHLAQLISPGKFAQFDYGEEENLRIYNQTTAPEYDFNKIRIPMRLYHGNNDIIANSLDTQLLYQKLPKPMGCILIPHEKWNHVDFLWAQDVNRLFNEDLLQFLRNVTENNFHLESAISAAIEDRRSRPIPIDTPFDEEAYRKYQASGSLNETNVPIYFQEMVEQRLWLAD